jgi:hypothetical protein
MTMLIRRSKRKTKLAVWGIAFGFTFALLLTGCAALPLFKTRWFYLAPRKGYQSHTVRILGRWEPVEGRSLFEFTDATDHRLVSIDRYYVVRVGSLSYEYAEWEYPPNPWNVGQSAPAPTSASPAPSR